VEAAVTVLEKNDIKAFGQLLTASHLSLSEDFEVTCPETDALVHFMTHHPSCAGGRQMGGGFGGCCLALVETGAVKHFSDYVSRKYQTKTGLSCDIYPVEISDGVRRLE
jgi:galactokinase